MPSEYGRPTGYFHTAELQGFLELANQVPAPAPPGSYSREGELTATLGARTEQIMVLQRTIKALVTYCPIWRNQLQNAGIIPREREVIAVVNGLTVKARTQDSDNLVYYVVDVSVYVDGVRVLVDIHDPHQGTYTIPLDILEGMAKDAHGTGYFPNIYARVKNALPPAYLKPGRS